MGEGGGELTDRSKADHFLSVTAPKDSPTRQNSIPSRG